MNYKGRFFWGGADAGDPKTSRTIATLDFGGRPFASVKYSIDGGFVVDVVVDQLPMGAEASKAFRYFTHAVAVQIILPENFYVLDSLSAASVNITKDEFRERVAKFVRLSIDHIEKTQIKLEIVGK